MPKRTLRSAKVSLVTDSPDPDRICLAKSFFFSWSCKIFVSTVPSQTNLQNRQANNQKLKAAYLITCSNFFASVYASVFKWDLFLYLAFLGLVRNSVYRWSKQPALNICLFKMMWLKWTLLFSEAKVIEKCKISKRYPCPKKCRDPAFTQNSSSW